MGLGFGELLVILFIVLLFFGANRLPAMGAGLGKAIKGFKDAIRSEPPADKPRPPPGASTK
ncbi:MAG TPA: twin-arginine translocase TatA/TatE family subunit [Anaeromyxobacter sp.]